MCLKESALIYTQIVCTVTDSIVLITELTAMAAVQDQKKGILLIRQRRRQHKNDMLRFQKRFWKLTSDGLEYYKENKVIS